MNGQYDFRRGLPPGAGLGISPSPLARIVGFVVLALLLAGALFVGFFVVTTLVLLGAVAFAAFRTRLWWHRRKLRGADAKPEGSEAGGAFGTYRKPTEPDNSPASGDTLDGEYEVIDRKPGH